MIGQTKISLKKSTAAAALAGALTISPIAALAAPGPSAASADLGVIDAHYHRIHDHRGGVPLITGLALGLIGVTESAELYPYYDSPPYYYGPRYYYGGPYVGSYFYSPRHS